MNLLALTNSDKMVIVDDEDYDAARAYDLKAKELFGDFFVPNLKED